MKASVQESEVDTQIDLFPETEDNELYGTPREGLLQSVDGTWDDDVLHSNQLPGNQNCSNSNSNQSACDSNCQKSSDVIGHKESHDHTFVMSLDGTYDNPSDGEPESPIPRECRRSGRTSTPLGQKRSLSDNSPNKLSRSGKRSRRTLYTESEGSIYAPQKGKTVKSQTPAKNAHFDENCKVHMKQSSEASSISSYSHSKNKQDVNWMDYADSERKDNQSAHASVFGFESPVSSQADNSMEENEDLEFKREMAEQYYNHNDNGRLQRRSKSDPRLFDGAIRDSEDVNGEVHDMGANAGADIKREEYLNDPNTGKGNVKKMVCIIEI